MTQTLLRAHTDRYHAYRHRGFTAAAGLEHAMPR